MSELSDEELWGELESAAGQRRGEILLELADRCYQRNDMSQFEALVAAAAEASESAGDDRLAAYARFNQGQGLMELDRFAEAVESFLTAAENFGAIGAQADVALATQRAADAYAAMNNIDDAMASWQSALALFRAEDDLVSVGRVHMAMGAASITSEQPDPATARRQAELSFNAARSAFRSARAAQHVAWADDAVAEAMIQQGRAADALPLLRSCLDIARVGVDDIARGYAGLRLGLVLRIIGEQREALEHLRDARAAYQADENLMGVARCDLEAGHALRGLRDVAAAETLYQQARSIFDAMGADEYLVLTDHARAELLLGQGRAAESVALSTEGLTRAVDTGELVMASDHAALLADALLDIGQPGEALSVVTDHLVEPVAGVEPIDRARHLAVMAKTLLANNAAGEALAVVESALRIPEARTEPALHGSLYELRWRSRDPGDESERDLAHAIALYLAAGDADRATALSAHLLPDESAPAVRVAELLSLRGLRPEMDAVPRSPAAAPESGT